MRVITTVAQRFFAHKFVSKGMAVLLLVYIVALGAISYERWHAYEHQQEERCEHQESDRKSWESNPDKHPHRMAHFGAFAFRTQHPLSIFDAGIESYMGNVVFLEAHKQNTANFSEASLSTGLVRFGDLHIAMLLYLILPLFIFFIGFDALTRERELRTLKLMYIQGAELRDIVLGKALGLFMGAALFFVPALIVLWAIASLDIPAIGAETVLRIVLLSGVYVLFFAVLCLITVLVSAWSKTSNQSLLTMLGFWLLFFIVVPKVAQSIGSAVYPAPAKLAFKRAIEEEVVALGNPHDVQDPHFDKMKDSLYRIYKVSDITELPFNFGGWLAGWGERMTSAIHAEHQAKLMNTYRRQNAFAYYLSVINPHLAMRELSMALSGTDFDTYDNFLLQAEQYRYDLATYMAELQTKYVNPKTTSGGTEGKKNAVSREEFKRFRAFEYRFQSVGAVLRSQALPIVSLILMFVVLIGLAHRSDKYFSVS